jgi:glyoxylase-like metal-dependent hydrolase (beta-lactamase superfamily II)
VWQIPGHPRGHLALHVTGEAGGVERVFTGDTLFRRSVGGTRAPGHGSFADLRRSVLDVLLALPAATLVYPGHTDETVAGEELEENPFVRAWRGLDPPGDEPCTYGGRKARLLVWARDYDGGHKAWVRFEDGEEDVVPGSRVVRERGR